MNIVFQVTGNYKAVGEKAIASYEKYFMPNIKKEYIIFSEHEEIAGIKTRKLPVLHSLKYSVYRYELFLDAEHELMKSDYVFYADADTEVVKEIDESILPVEHDVLAVQHPFGNQFSNLPKRSKYFLPDDQYTPPWWQCCFFGGKSRAIIDMAKEIAPVVREEISFIQHHVADEGYFNSYWQKRRDKVKILGNEYAYPTNTTGWPAGAWSLVLPEDVIIKHYNSGSFGV